MLRDDSVNRRQTAFWQQANACFWQNHWTRAQHQIITLIKERKGEAIESVTVSAGAFECYKIAYLMDCKMLGKMRHSKSTA